MARELRKRIEQLAATKLAGSKDALDELLVQVRRAGLCADLRNRFVHGVWCRNTTGGAARIRDVRHHKWHPMPTVKDLRRAERKTAELVEELNHSRLKGRLKQALS